MTTPHPGDRDGPPAGQLPSTIRVCSLTKEYSTPLFSSVRRLFSSDQSSRTLPLPAPRIFVVLLSSGIIAVQLFGFGRVRSPSGYILPSPPIPLFSGCSTPLESLRVSVLASGPREFDARFACTYAPPDLEEHVLSHGVDCHRDRRSSGVAHPAPHDSVFSSPGFAKCAFLGSTFSSRHLEHSQVGTKHPSF